MNVLSVKLNLIQKKNNVSQCTKQLQGVVKYKFVEHVSQETFILCSSFRFWKHEVPVSL